MYIDEAATRNAKNDGGGDYMAYPDKTNKSSVQDVNRTQAAGVRVKCPISELLCPIVDWHREAKERNRNQQSPSLC